jgi:4-amino-4-deoxy-L-arabinose transferase-like glycosyltransferase
VSTVAAPGAAIETRIRGKAAPAVRRDAVPWVLAAIVATGVAARFASLGVQSFHHDEVITAMRVIPGSLADMLHQVRTSESNPPLYYLLAWGWAKVFGSSEFGLRSLSALFGAATVPVGYLIGRQLVSRRTGLILAALLALNPMLIWYSQEARCYAVLVFFCAVSLLFFVRALDARRGRDLALWALASALALCSHYFAVFAIGIEAAWLLIALRERWRAVLPALGIVVATGLALLPLLAAQVNPEHIGWIEGSPLSLRFWETGVSFLAGETGHVIAEPPRERYALVPAIAIGLALALLAFRGTWREWRGAAIGLVLGLGVPALAGAAALAGKDYIFERNLLPALVPLSAVAAIGFGVSRARRTGLILALVLCLCWAAFAVYVTQTPNLQRPDFRQLSQALGSATGRRAVVSWRLAAEPERWYLHDGSLRIWGGVERLREIDLVGKHRSAAAPVNLPPSFRPVQRLRLDRLTLTRYVSKHPVKVRFHTLAALPTGFGAVGVVLDGPRPLPPTGVRSHPPVGLARAVVAR